MEIVQKVLAYLTSKFLLKKWITYLFTLFFVFFLFSLLQKYHLYEKKRKETWRYVHYYVGQLLIGFRGLYSLKEIILLYLQKTFVPFAV